MDVLKENKKGIRDSGRRSGQCSFWDTKEASTKVKNSVWREINNLKDTREKYSSGFGFRE